MPSGHPAIVGQAVKPPLGRPGERGRLTGELPGELDIGRTDPIAAFTTPLSTPPRQLRPIRNENCLGGYAGDDSLHLPNCLGGWTKDVEEATDQGGGVR